MNKINNPENSLPHHLRGAFRGFETALGRYLKPYNLPVSQFYILRLQWDANGYTQKDISDRAFMSESVTSQVIKKMEQHGLLIRRADKTDARTQNVFITSKGKVMREKIIADGLSLSKGHGPDISKEDIITTVKVLKQIRLAFAEFNQH